MSELSPGLTLAWQISVSEADYINHQFALCKVADLLRPEVFGQIEGLNKNKLKAELEALEGLFVRLNIDRTRLRRRLRGILCKGSYKHTEKVIHRSEECKRYFEKAAERAVHYKSSEANIFHLLAVIIEDPGVHIINAFSELNINAQELKAAAEGIGRGFEEAVHAFAEAEEPQKEAKYGSKTPYIDKYGRDITRLAKEGRLQTIVERRAETLQVIRTLTKNRKNNPLLIGEPGVGKTAIVEGLALRISKGNITPLLHDKRIIELNISSLVAGTKYRGEFEERLNRIIAEAKSGSDVILFIDEIHTLIGAGRGGDALDAANIMKPALGRGEIACIGATTISEYRKYIENDPALERRFQPIVINEPSPEDAVKILNNLVESWKDAQVDASAIRAAVDLSVRHIKDRRLPDKAIDILEEAYSRVKVPQLSVYGNDKEEASCWIITSELVADVVSELTGIPPDRLNEAEKERLLNMAETVKKRVIGQDEAVERVCGAVRMQRAGLKDAKRPIGVFLFLGPTGVGKTELAKAIAEFLFGSEDEIIRLDMSEFMERYTVSKLIGAPPGYIGHDEEGQLTVRLRKKPYSVVLLDEIEKAHPDVFDLFLQVFDEGRLTDSKGRVIDARNALFIMTSNIGTELYYKEHFGFINPNSEDGKAIKNNIKLKLKQTFRAEFLNRIDEIIFFKHLSQDDLIPIALNIINAFGMRLKDKGIKLNIGEGAIELICKEGFDPANGARPLKRAIERLIVKPLSEKMIQGMFEEGDTAAVKARDGEIILERGEDKKDTE
jgi:ATP-dependent Clp protease ATP-binding subunit ClpC